MSPDDPFAALQAIPGELRSTRETLEALQIGLREEKRERRNMAAVLAAVLAAIALAFGVYAYVNEQGDSAATARIQQLVDQRARQAAAECRNINETRLRNTRLWDKALAAAAGTVDPAALAALRAEADRDFAPLDCARLASRP